MAALRSCSGQMSALEVESPRRKAGAQRMRHVSYFLWLFFCTLIDPEPRGHEDAYSHLWMLCCCCDRFCGMKVLVVENVRLLLLF